MKHKKIFVLLLLCLLCFAQPAHAQFRNWAKSLLRKQTESNSIQKSSQRNSARLENRALINGARTVAAGELQNRPSPAKFNQLARQMQAAARQNRREALWREFDQNAQLSVFLARQNSKHPWDRPLAASGFVFETDYQGSKEIWGLTARHVADMLGDEFNAVFYRDGKEFSFPVKVVQRGTNESADAALLQLPPEAASVVRPLSLGHAKKDEPTVSYGYAENVFKKIGGREMLAVAPLQLQASLPVPAVQCKGMCGGPLLNAQRKAVGIYCGHSFNSPVGYAVNAEVVQDLLRAYRNGGVAMRTLKINGIPVGKINVDQVVSRITAYSGLYVTDYFILKRSQGNIDYSHLENLIRLEDADRVEISLTPGVSLNQKLAEPAKQIFLTLDLRTKKVTRMEYFGPLMGD